MMRFILILTLLITSFNSIIAQRRPEIFPEDIESNTLNLSQPGVDHKSRSRGLDNFLSIFR